ncbi:energy-coupling factor ABC transporter ATP-binding protein [Agreia sp. COWG]|uniref:energy-coupling factor ABC transporter ATP-binding protein n=1 Tax=Agreia sp. COWG TaxID=2773266 RepID=UPI001927282E|nr:energy-coupling factor ABC transporter ATP-binding protein [Agreia sp. COWG]CAD5997978.1 Biotin transport system ATP-binding protein [Agreia sp. COWG]
MNSDRLISFRGVSVDFEQRNALRDVSVVLDQKRIAVIGSNGSGKSTFARLLNGLASSSRGYVRVHGLDPVRQARLLRRRVGFIFSNPDSQIVMPTVAEDIAFSLRGRHLTRAEVDRRVSLVADSHGLAGLEDSPAHSLSGGQKQLLALSSVLITEPQLIVADEPTALLDAANTRRISAHLLDEMPQQLVLVTHDLRLAERCDIALWFDEGQLVGCGDPRDVIADYERSHA